MSRFPLVVAILLSFLSVRSDGQCSCSDLAVIQQVLQEEIFENKVEISKLRSEIQTISNGPELIEADSVKDEDINTRVEILERRLIELGNASSERKPETDQNDAILIRKQELKDLQSIVRNTLQNEKTERVNFISNVQNKIEKANDKISIFMKTTDAFLEEKANKWSTNYDLFENNSSLAFSDFRRSFEVLFKEHVTETNAILNLLKDSFAEFERNVSQNVEDFNTSITIDMNDKIQKNVAIMEEIKGDVTNLTRNVDKTVSTISSLEANVGDLTEVVKHSKNAVSELRGQVNKRIGTCDIYGLHWSLLGKKCYRFIDQEKSWYDSNRACARLNGRLVRIDSIEENDFITKSFTEGKRSYWIGLHDRYRENVWTWSSYSGNLASRDFTNWAPNEPSNAGGNEDCVHIYANHGLWNDLLCTDKFPFICEADPRSRA